MKTNGSDTIFISMTRTPGRRYSFKKLPNFAKIFYLFPFRRPKGTHKNPGDCTISWNSNFFDLDRYFWNEGLKALDNNAIFV